jgi:hypothetical protein
MMTGVVVVVAVVVVFAAAALENAEEIEQDVVRRGTRFALLLLLPAPDPDNVESRPGDADVDGFRIHPREARELPQAVAR